MHLAASVMLAFMPLSGLSLSCKTAWNFLSSNNAFGPLRQGPASIVFNLYNINLAQWDDLFVQQYVIFVAAPTGATAALVSGGSLTVGTPYFYKITGTALSGGPLTETTGSNEVTVTPTAGSQSASLSWTQLSQATGYNIYRSTTSGSYTSPALVGTVSGGSTLAFTDTGVAAGAGAPPSSLPNNYVEFALNSFTNLVGEVVAPGHLLALMLSCTAGAGATCSLAPGAANGLAALFSGTTPAINVPVSSQGGGLVVAGGIDATGFVIDSTYNSLRITDGGTGNLTASVAAIVGA